MSVVLTPPATANLMSNGGTITPPDIEKFEGKVVDYEPFLPHQKHHKASPPEFLTMTEEQEAVYQEVDKHFAAEDYVIPGLEAADGKLTEEEKFYLVSALLSPFFCLFEVLMIHITLSDV